MNKWLEFSLFKRSAHRFGVRYSHQRRNACGGWTNGRPSCRRLFFTSLRRRSRGNCSIFGCKVNNFLVIQAKYSSEIRFFMLTSSISVHKLRFFSVFFLFCHLGIAISRMNGRAVSAGVAFSAFFTIFSLLSRSGRVCFAVLRQGGIRRSVVSWEGVRSGFSAR